MSSASSFVDQINSEHSEVLKAEASALPHAIKCGELLNLAKENVKAEKKKWLDWLKAKWPKISGGLKSVFYSFLPNYS